MPKALQQPLPREGPQDAPPALRRARLVCPDMHLGLVRVLVRVVYSGELLYLALSRLCVQALHVPLFADLDRAVDEYLYKAPGPSGVLPHLPHLVPHFPVGGDGGDEVGYPVLGEELRDPADAPYVGVPVLPRVGAAV